MRAWLLLLASCTTGNGPGTSEDDTGMLITPLPGEVIQFPWGSVQVQWIDEAIVVQVEEPGEYQFGMAPTGCSAGDACWYGEDCHRGDESGYSYCHTFGGSNLSLAYGANPGGMSVGTQTAFAGPGDSEGMTYYLGTSANDCWTWGDNPAYYENGLGCNGL